MISEEEALGTVLGAITPLPAEEVPLLEGAGRYVAASEWARLALPGFDNSAMDGYAVKSAEVRPGVNFRVVGEQPAGADRELAVGSGETIRIFTGAPMPRGADAVVMQEDAHVEGDVVAFDCEHVESGENVRGRGADVCTGQKLVESGERIAAPMIALLAAQGCARVRVGGRPRVAILSTGDELQGPGAPLPAGTIFDSNGPMLAALARQMGAELISVGTAPDEPGPLREKLRAGLDGDLLVVTGGVSVGERDLVKTELRALGVELAIWRVAIKPGKPFAFGRTVRCAVFGLPGNPVSAFVTWMQFVRPALLKMMGASSWSMPAFPAVLTEAISNPGDRPHYVRGRFAEGKFTPLGLQQSHALFGLSRSNALVRVPPQGILTAGSSVSALVWDVLG